MFILIPLISFAEHLRAQACTRDPLVGSTQTDAPYAKSGLHFQQEGSVQQ